MIVKVEALTPKTFVPPAAMSVVVVFQNMPVLVEDVEAIAGALTPPTGLSN